MNATGYVVGVIGASGLLAREVVGTLRERGFPLAEMRLFESADRLGDVDVEELGARAVLLETADFARTQIVFACGSEAQSVQSVPRALSAGSTVIDLTQVFADDADVPIIVPEVNAEAIGEVIARRLVTSPVPGATALSAVLQPLHQAAVVRRVVVAGFEPVSTEGQSGIDELARQTSELMNGREVEPDVFSERVAFNVIPRIGSFMANGKTRSEHQIVNQTKRVLGLPGLLMSVTSVRVPVFYGQGYLINVETENSLRASAARRLLSESPGLLVKDEITSDEYPTLADVVGSDATFVGRIHDDPSVSCGINLWVALDGARKGSAGNAVQIAELLARAISQASD
jgi:aspartate-semialdehyde dehydrogenase